MKKPAPSAILFTLSLACLATPAMADHGRDHHREHWRGDIHRFHEHDWARWHGGHWAHARHGGRAGWWWVIGPTWYWYPSPVYPYPDPYQPPVVAAPPAAPAPPQYWYYCANPQGYYPYVPQCGGPWQKVPANP